MHRYFEGLAPLRLIGRKCPQMWEVWRQHFPVFSAMTAVIFRHDRVGIFLLPLINAPEMWRSVNRIPMFVVLMIDIPIQTYSMRKRPTDKQTLGTNKPHDLVEHYTLLLNDWEPGKWFTVLNLRLSNAIDFKLVHIRSQGCDWSNTRRQPSRPKASCTASYLSSAKYVFISFLGFPCVCRTVRHSKPKADRGDQIFQVSP